MIGDDIVSDVGGAQACGIRGIQVRTGKYRFTVQHCLISSLDVIYYYLYLVVVVKNILLTE